jgi:hypothetical protein
MGEFENLTKEEVMEIIKDFPVKPMFNNVIITTNNVVPEDDELEDLTPSFDPVQYVLAVGDHVRGIFPGDKVQLDLEKMMEKVPSSSNSYELSGILKLKPVELDDKFYAMIEDRKIDLIFTK